MEKINYGVALFVYNRPETTLEVLKSLQINNIKELYVFQDGLKCDEHREGWEDTRRIIEEIDWCIVNKEYAEKNKGLAESIVFGVSKVLIHKEAVVVIEDDCVLREDFMTFMESSFLTYKDSKDILSVSGYSWPINVPERYEEPVYATYRACSWGWGTWKDRWELFERNYKVIHEIKANDISKELLEDYGMDLEAMLKRNVGRETSWAVFWALCGIKYNMKSICPVENMVNNIGYGKNSGVHLARKRIFERELELKKIEFQELPTEVIIDEEIKLLFKEMLIKYNPKNLEARLSYYRKACNLWIEVAQKGIDIGTWLSEKGINSCVLFGADRETELMCKAVEKKLKIEYIMVSNAVNINEKYGIKVYDSIQDDCKNELIIIMPGFDYYNIDYTFELEKFGQVYHMAELMEVILEYS